MKLKRICSLVLCAILCFNLLSGCGKNTETTITSGETAMQDYETSASEKGEASIPENEYDRTIWYGFVSKELSENRDKNVTWQEYCTMIGNMLSVKDEALGESWQELASLALNSDEEMVRDQGCFALYRAAELMGEELNDGGNRSNSTNPHLLPSNTDNLPISYDYLPFTGVGNDMWIFDESYEGLFGQMNYIRAAIMFCQYRMSLCSFETLYDTQKGIVGPLTVEDAALSVLRLFESTHEPMETYWLDRIDKINEEITVVGEPESVTEMREQILSSESKIVKSGKLILGQTYTGTAYYVSNNGNDNNDGLTPETAWATIDKVNNGPIDYGDAVFFERGGIYRGVLYLYNEKGHITVSSYGEGAKPVITSAEECAAGTEKWTLWKDENGVKIWRYYKDCLDCGLIVFNDEKAGNKILAEWSGAEWVNDDGTPFDIASSLTQNLDFFSDDGGRFGGAVDFEVNSFDPEAVKCGPLYLRCDEGNPGEMYDCIELCTMTTTDMRDGGYEGDVIGGVDGMVYDNLCIKYFPMGGINSNQRDEFVVQNCELAWGGGCVQYVENGKVSGQMGDAIVGCGIQHGLVTGNYIHDIASSALIIESYSDVQFNSISISGNLIERTSNGINIRDNENISFENVSFDDNVFYLVGVSDTGIYDVRSGRMTGGEWTACYRIRDPYEYTNCTISGNKMYYPLYFFYYCDVPLPNMSDNLYVPSKYNSNFADLRYDLEVGPFLPSSLDESETIISTVFNDSTSIVDLKSIE